MTAHLHAEYVDGCFRCELSRDETIRDDTLEAINVQLDMLADRDGSSLRYAQLRHGYALVREDRP